MPPARAVGRPDLDVHATPLPTVVAYDAGGAGGRPPGFPLRATVLVAGTWPLARGLTPLADALVVNRPARSAADVVGMAREVRAVGRTPVVVRAEVSAAERAALAGLQLTAIVSRGAAAEATWGAVQAAISVRLLHAIAGAITEARLHPGLRAATTALCALDPPPTSVAALAARADVHRRTLWYQWRGRTRTQSPRLEDAVMAVVLLRASVRWVTGASWRAAGVELGVHRHTLARAARAAAIPRLPGTAAWPGDAAHAAIRGHVVTNVARPLLRGQALREVEAVAFVLR